MGGKAECAGPGNPGEGEVLFTHHLSALSQGPSKLTACLEDASVPQFPHWWKLNCSKVLAKPCPWEGVTSGQRQPGAGCQSMRPRPPQGTRSNLGPAWGHVSDVHRGLAAGTYHLTADRCPGHWRWGMEKPHQVREPSLAVPAVTAPACRQQQGLQLPGWSLFPSAPSIISQQHQIHYCQHCRARAATQWHRTRSSSTWGCQIPSGTNPELETTSPPEPGGGQGCKPGLGWGRVQAPSRTQIKGCSGATEGFAPNFGIKS